MKIAKQFAFGLIVLAVLVAAVVGVQVVPSLVAPRSTPDLTTLPAPTLSPTEQAGLVNLAQAFDGPAALAHVYELCADRYDGRRAGTAGAQQAAAYIAARFREYGLQPAGDIIKRQRDTGTYFQDFTIDYLDLKAAPELALLDQDGAVKRAFLHHQDFREVVSDWRGPGTVTGEVVYLGAAEAVDFTKIDVRDRVVLCHPTSTRFAAERAANAGAVALLSIVRDEHDIRCKGGYYPWRTGEAIPCLKIGAGTGDKLLRAAGRSLDSASTVGEPFRAGVTVRVSVSLAMPKSAPAHNVLGLLPGTDPARADEVLILGAHFDHIGRDPDGTLYPGAIDNASGVAVLLEIARLWREQGFQPRVCVLFAAWDAEEAGLLGSTHYVEHPRYPLDRTIAMIQMDSVGGGGDLLAVTPTSPPLQEALLESARRLNLRLGIVSEEGSSDHVPFDEAGVPAAMLIWADAWSAIHVPTDTPDMVRAESLRQTGAIVDLTLMRLASGEEL